MPYLERAHGVRLFYRVVGETAAPKVIVFLSGWTSDHNFWVPYLPSFSDYRCVLVDHRGVGKTEVPAGVQWTMDDLVEDFMALLGAVGSPRATFFGISMGGMIAQNFARLHPESCERLLLLSTTPYIPANGRALFEALVRVEETSLELFVELLLSHCYSEKAWTDPKAHATYEQTVAYKRSHPQSPGDCRRQLEAFLAHDVRPFFPQIHCPVLILCGEHDLLTPPWLSHLLQEGIPGAQILILPQEGHVPLTLDFLPNVKAFLTR